MRVFTVPASVPFLRTLVAALVDGRLVDGFEAHKHPERMAQATLYLPTRRAGRLVREIFLDELKTEALLLPRIQRKTPPTAMTVNTKSASAGIAGLTLRFAGTAVGAF